MAYDIHEQANFFFFLGGGVLFTSHWLNLQHWTGFYIAVYGNFQGLFFYFRGLFFALRGRNRPEPPCNFSPVHEQGLFISLNSGISGHMYGMHAHAFFYTKVTLQGHKICILVHLIWQNFALEKIWHENISHLKLSGDKNSHRIGILSIHSVPVTIFKLKGNSRQFL